MNSQKRADNLRRDIAGIAAIILGLAIGLFIKRIRIG
jgi:hypothetical protein